MSIINVTKDNFPAQVQNAELPVLINFTAPWCGYCRRISPVIDTIAGAYSDKLIVGKIDVDEQQDLEDRFEVMTIPTLMLFKNGQAGEPLVNPRSKTEIDSWLSRQGVQ